MTPLVEVSALQVSFASRGSRSQAVRNVSFAVHGERLGIVGESGSGKSTVARALMGLLPRSAEVRAQRLAFAGIDLRSLSQRAWSGLRGRRIAMVMQDPRYSLNPVQTVGSQVAEGFRIHLRMTRVQAARRAVQALEEVQIRDPERVAMQYPHQLSGGMGQRVMIAAMLAAEPELLIADEPTSALDTTVAQQILALLDQIIVRRGMGLIMISHNLPLVSHFCDRVLVMHGGAVLEDCAADRLAAAHHPYTRALLAAIPDVRMPGRRLPVPQKDASWMP
jgi:peptide/nickel transport system ATP-binding protein